MPAILAFTSPQVQRLTGLTARRLAYWEATGVYQPAYKDDRPRRAYRRIYSFRDVVSLRTLATLRDAHRVPLEELRRTGQYLMQFTDDPWSRRFVVQNRRVTFQHPGSEFMVDRLGQTSYVDYGAIWDAIERETECWTERDPNDVGHVARHRHVQHNRWVIKGTRIPTETVWRFHAAGYDVPHIIEQYPTLQPADVTAAIEFERARQPSAA